MDIFWNHTITFGCALKATTLIIGRAMLLSSKDFFDVFSSAKGRNDGPYQEDIYKRW